MDRRMRCKPTALPSTAGAVLLILLGTACGPQENGGSGDSLPDAGHLEEEEVRAYPAELEEVLVVPERWVSAWDTASNLDSPAFWSGPQGDWVVATAKGTHDLWLFDASTGALLRRVGGKGAGPGQFQYPNGIAVLGDFLYVVERDNHRVQVFSLPEFGTVGSFGSEDLVRPYGIALYADPGGAVEVYITDDYGNEEDLPEGQEPSGDFTRRLSHFRVSLGNGPMDAGLVRRFGEPDGPGALRVVESIQVDETFGNLLVADEHGFELEVYALDGTYTGQTVGSGLYRFGDPEGIMLYRCGREGYWILTDQGERRTVFHVLDRESFGYLGSFTGEETANTDGIWLTQKRIPGLGGGALFALHDDGGLAAFAWEDIAGAMELETGCTTN